MRENLMHSSPDKLSQLWLNLRQGKIPSSIPSPLTPQIILRLLSGKYKILDLCHESQKPA